MLKVRSTSSVEFVSQVNKKGVILISGSSKSDVLGLSKTMFNESSLTYNNNHVFEFSTPSLSSNLYTELRHNLYSENNTI